MWTCSTDIISKSANSVGVTFLEQNFKKKEMSRYFVGEHRRM
jgi:hypothetical protein